MTYIRLRYCRQYIVFSLLAGLFLNACSFLTIKPNTDLGFNTSILSGFVHVDPQKQGPILITAYNVHNDNILAKGHVRLSQSGFFYLPVPNGMYYLAAFQDHNENEIYDPQEDCAQFGAPDLINAARQHIVTDLNMVLTTGEMNNIPHLRKITINKKEIINQAEAGRTVRSSVLFNRRTHVALGYVKPYHFLKRMGANIWFVESYNPAKIPILFIHGSGGSPADWEFFVENIDQSVYQPWFFYYPSGLPLEFSSKILASKIQELKTKYDFEQLSIVAHSMGALVARFMFIHSNKSFQYIGLFISISAPWGGVDSAKVGAQTSPIKVASWRDIATGSYFIDSLYERKLPKTVHHYLLFGYQDNRNALDPNSDGVITLKSMLDSRAQQEAIRVYGFHESHASILKSQDTLIFLKDIIRQEIVPEKSKAGS